MKRELLQKKNVAKNIIESIPKRIKREDKRQFLEVVVKNHIYELENDELEYNLRLQEKLNMILVNEIKRLREDNDIEDISENLDNDEDINMSFEEKNEWLKNNQSSVIRVNKDMYRSEKKQKMDNLPRINESKFYGKKKKDFDNQ